MPTSETRIAARDASGVELYYQHSTLPTKENVAAYEAFYHGAAKKMPDMAASDKDAEWEIDYAIKYFLAEVAVRKRLPAFLNLDSVARSCSMCKFYDPINLASWEKKRREQAKIMGNVAKLGMA